VSRARDDLAASGAGHQTSPLSTGRLHALVRSSLENGMIGVRSCLSTVAE